MPFSDSYANQILNWALGKGSLTNMSQVWIGLCTNDPEANNGTFNELSGKGYARVLISQYNETYPNFISSATNRQIQNTYQINWTKATADWERVKGFGLFTSSSGTAAPFFYGKLDLNAEDEANGGILCVAGAVMLFDPQTLKISFPKTDV